LKVWRFTINILDH